MNAIADRRNTDWRAVTRVSARISAIVAVSLATLWTAPTLAQAPAWPTDGQQQAAPSGPAWPADGGGAQQSRPAAVAPAPMMGAPGGFGPPAGGGRPPGMSPGTGAGMGPPPNAQQQQCIGEFNKLRGEVDKKGKVAKAISERKGTREELCGAITGVFGAESKWVKYAKENATVCGIPPEIIKQLDGGHANLSKTRTQICSGGGPAGGAAQAPRAPSLSEALGTTNLPTEKNTNVKRGGTLDTLTGNPIR